MRDTYSFKMLHMNEIRDRNNDIHPTLKQMGEGDVK